MNPRKNPVVFPPKRTGKRAGRRGFTLVEIALAMAVIGLLLGATVMSSRALEERRQVKMEMERLQRVSDAVVGYALRNRTRERVIKFVAWELPHVEWAFRLPAGRPYLPCPDWNGDGYEDRWPGGANGFAQGVEIKPDLTVTATIGVSLSRGGAYLVWVDLDEHAAWDSRFHYGWRPYGECRISKGAVPWRTLGVEPSDSWGNRHTYFADPVFSNAIFGFDRQTVADIYNPRIPIAPGMTISRREREQLDHCPASICNGGLSEGYACAGHGGDCRWRLNISVLPELILKAGGVADTNIHPASGSSRSKRFDAGQVTDGLPFVLVSHGPNGRFAVNHWATLNDPIDDGGFMRPICNHYAWSEDGDFGPRIHIQINPVSPTHIVSTENIALLYEAANGNRLPSGMDCPPLLGDVAGADFLNRGLGLNTSFFVWQPPGIGDRNDFDDLLLWKTREELTAVVHGRIPRLPHMAIPYFPE